jgi:serine/threonine protein kinase
VDGLQPGDPGQIGRYRLLGRLGEGGPRIIDFGIARAFEASAMTTAGAVFSTFAFMSPEHVRGDPVGPASDVFSLGCTLAFAATARAPFGEDSIVTVTRRIAPEPTTTARYLWDARRRPWRQPCFRTSWPTIGQLTPASRTAAR